MFSRVHLGPYNEQMFPQILRQDKMLLCGCNPRTDREQKKKKCFSKVTRSQCSGYSSKSALLNFKSDFGIFKK